MKPPSRTSPAPGIPDSSVVNAGPSGKVSQNRQLPLADDPLSIVAIGADASSCVALRLCRSGTSDELRAFIDSASDEELRKQLLLPVHWDCGEVDLTQIKEVAALQSAWRAEQIAGATAAEGKALLDALVARVLDVACSKGTRQLTSIDLNEFIQEKLMVSVPRRALASLVGGTFAQQTTSLGITIDADAIPFPTPLLDRSALVSELAGNGARDGLLIVKGSSGKGKSTITRLIGKRIGGRWAVLDLRGQKPSQVNGSLLLAASGVARDKSSLILDDLPIEQDAEIERALSVLVSAVRSQDLLLLATTSNMPSARSKSVVGISDDAILEIPNLSEAEVSILIEKLGGDPKRWAAITHLVCGGGHPQLVVARLKRLSRDGWPSKELLGGFDPSVPATEIEDERTATRRRLYAELDDNLRAMIDRLSVVGLRFDRQMALAVGSEPPPLFGPGDALTQLVGPWVEELERGYFRLSPLLMNSARDNLTPTQIRAISFPVVNDIMGRSPIEGSLISVAFVHALASDHDSALARIASLPITLRGEQKRYLAEQLFGLEILRTDMPIRPENPHVSVLLREAQFQVCVERGSWDQAEAVATQLMIEVQLIPKDQMRDEMKAVAISVLLSEQKSPKNLPRWFDYLIDFSQLLGSVEGPLAKEMRDGAKRFQQQSEISLVQFLFVLGATRCSNISELETLFAQLNSIPPSTRSELLSALAKPPLDFKLMISSAWLGDHHRDAIDGHTAAQKYGLLATMANSWSAERLAIECEIARSVMLDEYSLGEHSVAVRLSQHQQGCMDRLGVPRPHGVA